MSYQLCRKNMKQRSSKQRHLWYIHKIIQVTLKIHFLIFTSLLFSCFSAVVVETISAFSIFVLLFFHLFASFPILGTTANCHQHYENITCSVSFVLLLSCFPIQLDTTSHSFLLKMPPHLSSPTFFKKIERKNLFWIGNWSYWSQSINIWKLKSILIMNWLYFIKIYTNLNISIQHCYHIHNHSIN